MRYRLLLIAAIVATSLTGCGAAPTTTGFRAQPSKIRSAKLAPAEAAPLKGETVNVQRDAVDLRGDFKVAFKGLGGGYKTLATRKDVHKISVTLTSPKLLKPLTKEVDDDDLLKPEIALYFEKVPAGEVNVTIKVLDENDFVIGTRENTSNIKPGETTLLEMSVELDASAGVGGFGGSISIIEPTPDASGTPEPEASTPIVVEPVTVVAEKLDRRLFSKPDAVITLKNPNAFRVETEVRVDFYKDQTIADTRDTTLDLEAGESKTIRVSCLKFWVDGIKTTVVQTELED